MLKYELAIKRIEMKTLNAIILAGLFVLMISSFQGHAANELETESSPLKPCPAKPNCVSSNAQDEDHFIQPFVYTAPPKEAWILLKAELVKLPRTTIVKEDKLYIHAESRSKVFGFIDDLEFYLHSAESRIEIRSASRSGYYDFDVNRKRIEQLRTALIKAGINSCPEIELKE
jgi:uncharacterized protein (DUF1499 family)